MACDAGDEPGGPGASGTALYIASMTNELARLAKSHHLDMLAYLLDMARLEADQVSKVYAEPNDGAPD
jgi:hypothetical protein